MKHLLLALAIGAGAAAESKEREEYRQAVESLTTAYLEQGTPALDERLADQQPATRLLLMNGVLARTYWTTRDIERVAALAQHALVAADAAINGAPDAATRRTLLERKGAIAYNLASYAWPGWGGEDAGVVLTAAQVRAGLDAAWLNVEIQQQLDSEEKKRAHSLWLAGAHQLAAGDRSGAVATFKRARALLRDADEQQEDYYDGWTTVAKLLGPADADQRAALEHRLDEIVQRMSQTKDGKFFAGQYGVALSALRAAPCPGAIVCAQADCACMDSAVEDE